MNRFLLLSVLTAFTVQLFSQGQVVWKSLEDELLPDTVELNRLPQMEQVVFEALISNISNSDYNVLLKRTIVTYTSGSSDQLCYGASCQFGDQDKTEIITNATPQAAGTNVNTIDPFEMIHFAPAEIAGTTILKYYIITVDGDVQTLQDSVVVKYVIAPYKRVDLRFSIDMSGATGFNGETQNVYVQAYSNEEGLTVKKMKKPTSGSVYTLGSTGHYYVDNDLTYTYKYFYGTNNSSTGVYDTIGEPGMRVGVAVQQEDEIAFADTWGVTVDAKQTATSLLEVFPNPFQSDLTVNNLEGVNTIEISNIIGQRVYSTTTNKTKFIISASDLRQGIYFIKITDANQKVHVERIIKK